MDFEAIDIVEKYIIEHWPRPYVGDTLFKTFIVWKSKALQNWKYMISTDLRDGMYYELSYNGDKKEWYLDAYRKVENKVIKASADV